MAGTRTQTHIPLKNKLQAAAAMLSAIAALVAAWVWGQWQ